MKTVPRFLRGPFRNALRVAMGEAVRPKAVRQERGWKLFLLLPRLLLHLEQAIAAMGRVQECERRLEELRAARNVQQAKPSLPPANAFGEVARLQQTVSDLQRQLQHQVGRVATPAMVPSRIRKREDYVPATDQEFLEWMADRQEEMNAALMSGSLPEGARVSGMITDATRSLQPVTIQPSMITNMVN